MARAGTAMGPGPVRAGAIASAGGGAGAGAETDKASAGFAPTGGGVGVKEIEPGATAATAGAEPIVAGEIGGGEDTGAGALMRTGVTLSTEAEVGAGTWTDKAMAGFAPMGGGVGGDAIEIEGGATATGTGAGTGMTGTGGGVGAGTLIRTGEIAGAGGGITTATATGATTGTGGGLGTLCDKRALASGVPSTPQIGHVTANGMRPFIGSTSNLYF